MRIHRPRDADADAGHAGQVRRGDIPDGLLQPVQHVLALAAWLGGGLDFCVGDGLLAQEPGGPEAGAADVHADEDRLCHNAHCNMGLLGGSTTGVAHGRGN